MSMHVRSREEVADALSDGPEEVFDLRQAVDRPTATEYARVKAQSPGERLQASFALMAWAINLSREAKRGADRG